MALNNQGIMQVSNNGKYSNWDDMPASLQEGVFAKLTAGYPNQALQRSRIYNAMRDPATMQALMTQAGVYDENAQLADPATQPNVLDDIMAMDGTGPAPVPQRKPANVGNPAPAPNVAQGPGGIGSDHAANMGNLPQQMAPTGEDEGGIGMGTIAAGAAVGGIGMYLISKLRSMGVDQDMADSLGQQAEEAAAAGKISPDAVKAIADDPAKLQQLMNEGPGTLLALPDYSQQPKPLAPPGPRPDFFMQDKSNESINAPASDMERNIDKSLADGENEKPKPKGVKAKTAKAKPKTKPRPRVRP